MADAVASTSLPSTRTKRIASPCAPGAARRPSWLAVGENSEYPLFSQKKTTGSSQTAARFSASWKAPAAVAPSPKNATETVSLRLQ